MDFFNNDYKKFLVAGDKILHHIQQDDSYKKFSVIIVALLSTFLLTLPVIGISFKLLHIHPFLILFILLIIFVLQVVVLEMSYTSKHFLITENGIYNISGLLSKYVKFIPYKKITDTSLTIGFIQGIYDVGTIHISTAGGTSRDLYSPYETSITNIKNFKKINDAITLKLNKSLDIKNKGVKHHK